MNHLPSTLHATIAMAPAPAKGGKPPNPFMSLLPLLLIFAIFYFLLMRPQQKRTKEHRAMLDELKPGDEILTNGGLYGRVVRVGKKRLHIEIADKIRVKLSKEHVARKITDSEDL